MAHWLLDVLRNDVSDFENRIQSSQIDEWYDLECKETFAHWKEHVGEAVSGFANTEGGLLLFGVSAKRSGKASERRTQLSPIDKLSERAGQIRENLGRAAEDPIDPNPTLEYFESPTSGPDTGYIAIEVHRSERRPHRAILGRLHRYYIRAGESFVIMPHTTLRDAFSREAEPQPRLSIQIRAGGTGSGPDGIHLYYDVFFVMANNGYGALRDPFLRIAIRSSDYGQDRPPYPLRPKFMANSGGDRISGYEFMGEPGTVLHPKRRCEIAQLRWGAIRSKNRLSPHAIRELPDVALVGSLAGSNFATRTFSYDLTDNHALRTNKNDVSQEYFWWQSGWKSEEFMILLTGKHGNAVL